jgi:hypothetical protein
MEKAELIITALQQRIGEIVSQYETQVAILRAELTTLMTQQEEKKQAMQEYNDELLERIEFGDHEV